MASKMADAIKQLIQERGISEDLVRKTIEESLLAAYKNKYGSMDNAVVRFSDDGTEVTVFSRKKIVDEVEDPVREISLSDAVEYNEESEIGDELLIEVSPKEFDRSAVQSAKQKTKQTLREIQRNTLYSEFKERVGEMIIGYYQRERNGNIFVDLGKTEGILPKKFQSPREIYHPSDRIRALIYEVSKSPTGLQIVLTRTHADFVKKTFELEVPELYDRTIEIYKIVREPGYRTKMAVYSNRDDVDPVGACVGLKGVRIQAVRSLGTISSPWPSANRDSTSVWPTGSLTGTSTSRQSSSSPRWICPRKRNGPYPPCSERWRRRSRRSASCRTSQKILSKCSRTTGSR
jgi:N utilization substance protein A